MTPTEKPRDQFLELVSHVLPWAIRKLDAGESFSCLMVLEDGEGRKGTIYNLRNTREGMEEAHNELRSDYRDVRAYAIAAPAELHLTSGDVLQGVYVEGESPEHDTPMAIGCLLTRSENGRLAVGRWLKMRTPEWSLSEGPGTDVS